jgi:hypothetical protein
MAMKKRAALAALVTAVVAGSLIVLAVHAEAAAAGPGAITGPAGNYQT